MRSRIFTLALVVVLSLNGFAARVATDRAWYLAGEAMRVSVAADDASIVYAELCDTYGLAAGVGIGLEKGAGTGTMELPSDLHSGYYVLSVYTRDNAQVSHQLVAVVNPLRKSVDDDIEWVADDSCWAADKGAADLIDRKGLDVAEKDGHIIKARVKNTADGQKFNGSQIRPSLSIVGKQIHYFEGKMVDDSTAVFNTYGVHGRLPLVLTAMSPTGVSLPIEMVSPFASLLPKRLPHLVFHYRRNEVEARSLDMQRHQMAIAPAKRELQLGSIDDDTAVDGVPLDYDDTLFGNKPDITYNLDEYRQFLTIREAMIEYVTSVVRKRVNGVTRLSILREQERYDSSLPTLVLIDGMPVSDTEQLLNYDARRLHYINIYDSQYTFGYGMYSGIISFVTRSGRLTNYPTERHAQYLVYEFP